MTAAFWALSRVFLLQESLLGSNPRVERGIELLLLAELGVDGALGGIVMAYMCHSTTYIYIVRLVFLLQA